MRSALEDQLNAHAGKSVETASEIADALAGNTFADARGNHVMTLFVDGALPADPLDGFTEINSEEVRLGERELFVLPGRHGEYLPPHS